MVGGHSSSGTAGGLWDNRAVTMGERKDATFPVPEPVAVAAAAVEQALSAIGAQVTMRAPEQGRFAARMSMNIRSFGEEIGVTLQPTGATSCTLHITSESPRQMVAWGKNEQNLRRFEAAFTSALALIQSGAMRREASTPSFESGREAAAPEPPAKRAAHRVFISYRRDDSATIVGRICDRLAHDVGATNIFKDIDNIPFGVDFVDYIDREVQKCTVLFAVIGPTWLHNGNEGRRRLEDANDFVRIEIGSALRRSIPIVPILVEGARMPRSEELPEELRSLVRRNGIEIRHDPDFHADMTRLLSRLG